MTNNTNNERKLAEVGARISARASLYHVLLVEVRIRTPYTYIKKLGWRCPFCLELTPFSAFDVSDTVHTPDCLIARIERALAADDATIRALLADVNPPEVDA